MTPLILASAIFVMAYFFIATEWIPKWVTAIAAGMLVIAFRLVSQEEAFHAIDFNVIFLLAGMMMIANILGKTGAFQWLAIRTAKLARGDPFLTLALLSIATAVVSAFIDNVTTVVLMVPITLYIASCFNISPMPFLIAEIIASNIGGTATLIGDPPNIMIGSAAGLDFLAFVAHLAPIIAVILLVFLIMARLVFARQLTVAPEKRLAVCELSEADVITDTGLLKKSLLVMGLVIIAFIFHGPLGYQPATIAMLGAAALIIISGQKPQEVLFEVEWPTLFFFMGLFIVVSAVVKAGVIDLLADGVLGVTGGSLPPTALALLWFSAAFSGMIDNIPYTATMIPLIKDLGQYMPILPLWWALSLGACLGGNLTIIGASANVYVGHLAERAGHPISFVEYLKYGALFTFVSIVLAMAYLWVRYLL